ncbi:MAG: hypothetical protein HC903_31640 [Methylacidiphilales bacterium]|nr:hypothetical protein [Candidatus Methylacidiphilales bacterium]NJR16188.1 hypothetical protein [Calothrix sp. CSU_2_0]
MVRASCPQIIKDGQDAHPTKLGNLFFGDPLWVVPVVVGYIFNLADLGSVF